MIVFHKPEACERSERRQILLAGVFALASTSCVCAAAPVYEPKDIDVSSNAVTCRVAGTPLLDGDAFSNAGFWTLNNYENRLGIEMGGERDGGGVPLGNPFGRQSFLDRGRPRRLRNPFPVARGVVAGGAGPKVLRRA